MARSFSCEVESPLSVDEIHGAFRERDFWQARLEDAAGGALLESFEQRPDGSVHVVVAQQVAGSVLPGPIGRRYPRGLEVVQGQTWSVGGADKLVGEVRTEARGLPGSGRSRLELATPRDDGTVACTGTFEFKVPLVGGTLENLFGRQLIDSTPGLLDFIARWLRERREA
jgi:hypothetical protein